MHSCRPVWAHTQQTFPHITSLLRNPLQGAKEVLFPFFKDDKCIDINIFLVPMATIFKRMELAYLPPHVVLFILDISHLLWALTLGWLL